MHGNVPRVGCQLIDALTFVCQADKVWPHPLFAMALKRKGTVVKSAPHSQSIAVVIKSHQRHQDQIELTRIDQLARSDNGFGNAEAIDLKLAVAFHRCKPQALAHQIRQHRQVTSMPVLPESRHDFIGGNFTIRGEIECDAFAGAISAAVRDLLRYRYGCCTLLLVRQTVARFAQLFS